MILCSLLDRFNVALHMNDLQKKYGNLNMNGSQLVMVIFQNITKSWFSDWSWKKWRNVNIRKITCEMSLLWLYLPFVICSIICCTHPPCLELCRFGGGGFDQGDDNRRFNSLLLRLLRTWQPERCHWINTVPDTGREGETKKGRGGENTIERGNEREGRQNGSHIK